MNETDRAVTNFQEGMNCCQAIITVYGPQLGLDRNTALLIGTGFGGGIARMGEICGAVSGSVMVLGLKYGTSNLDEADAKEQTIEHIVEFMNRFKARHGSLKCKDLIGCDMSTPEGRELAHEKNCFQTLCPGFVRTAAEFLEKML